MLRTRNNYTKVKCKEANLDCSKSFFANNGNGKWNKLPPSVTKSITIDALKTHLTGISSTLILIQVCNVLVAFFKFLLSLRTDHLI